MSAIAYADTAVPARRNTVRLSLGVLWHAVVLLGRHWPMLLAVSFFGGAAHGVLLWSAVRASRVTTAFGVLVLVLVPLSLLVALVLMLRVLRPSLPYVNRFAGGGGGDQRGLLTVIGSVAVPLLAIYVTYDFMKDDFSAFAYEVWRDTDTGRTVDRLPFSPTVSVIGIVVIAVVLRYLFGYVHVPVLRSLILPLSAYVEVVWLATLAMVGNVLKGQGWDWLDSRKVGEWWHTYWDHITPVLQPVRLILEGFWHDTHLVVLAPIAWLAVGAVVYGRQLPEPKLTDERTATSAIRWARRLPRPIGFLTTSFGSAVYKGFAPLINGLRMLGRAGLRPMLVFCVAFVILQFVRIAMWEIERLLLGPHDLQEFWMPLSYFTAPVNTAIYYVFVVCLVAAATDRILATDSQTPSAEPSTQDDPRVSATSEARNEAVRSLV